MTAATCQKSLLVNGSATGNRAFNAHFFCCAAGRPAFVPEGALAPSHTGQRVPSVFAHLHQTMRLPPSAVGPARTKASSSKPSKPAAAPMSHLRPPSTASCSTTGGWGCGFAAAAPEPQDEQCPAATPQASPAVTPNKSEGGRAAKQLLAEPCDAQAPAPTLPAAAGLPDDAQAMLEQLAGRLSAAAQSGGGLAGPTWEEAFLAGMAAGLALPTHGRHRSSRERTLLAVVLAGMLLVLGGSALLLAGVAQASPTVFYQ